MKVRQEDWFPAAVKLVGSLLVFYVIGTAWAWWWHTHKVVALRQAPVCQAARDPAAQGCISRVPATVSRKWEEETFVSSTQYGTGSTVTDHCLAIRFSDSSQQTIRVPRDFFIQQEPSGRLTADRWQGRTVRIWDADGRKVATDSHPANDPWLTFPLLLAWTTAATVFGMAASVPPWPRRRRHPTTADRAQAVRELAGWAAVGLIPSAVLFGLLPEYLTAADGWLLLCALALAVGVVAMARDNDWLPDHHRHPPTPDAHRPVDQHRS